MKKHLVTLNFKTRFSLPKVGNFHYSHDHEILVWKGQEYTDADSLAAAVNEALTYVESIGMEPRIIRVMSLEQKEEAEAKKPEVITPAQNEQITESTEPASEIISSPELATKQRKRGRPRKRLLTSTTP